MSDRPPRPGDPDADAPEWWRRSANLRKVPVIGIVVLVIIILLASRGSSPPAIKTSCTTPSFVLSTTHTKLHQALAWTATGPPGMTYQLTVGVSGFVTYGGRLHATPDPGLSTKQMQAASQPMTMPGNCKQSGHFAVFVGSGTFQVRMFRTGGTAAIPAATEVRAIALKVDPS